MKPNEQKKAAKAFVDRWRAAEGNEQREANSFWIELCSQVLGIANPTQHLDFERKVKGRRIDVFYEDRSILIENKSRGVSLDEPEQRGKDKYGNPRMVTPYEQARWYADTIVPRSIAPRWILTCNFDEIRIYDLDDEYAEDHYETILLDELPEQIHRLSFFTRKENSRLEREKDLSVAAGEVVGKLYDEFSKAYVDIENNKAEQRSLNVLITRIVFLLYAEDADLLQERNAFYKYLKNFQTAHMRTALIELFEALRTPKEERSAYMDPAAAAFPYVNGGLFADQIIIPQFTENARFLLLQEASAEFDWADISPTIFGAVFESTLNPQTRRSGGMHYTSIENIHKLTGPLFYDALKDELTRIEGAATEKERKFKLRAFREKLASLKFLDSAAGSGNFLTETYLSLRKLENRVLEDLYGGQMIMGEMDPIQVRVDQFYGIEINDFAVEVAKTALWIAELQMLDQTREILSMWIEPLPLKNNENIVCGNALRMDWNDVLPASEASYIIGNPPFVGQALKTPEQSEDVAFVFGKGNPATKLDYVLCWYKKAQQYMADHEIAAAFVSTNSICQGESIPAFWQEFMTNGAEIQFAYRSFPWTSEAADKATVHCVIVGFTNKKTSTQKMIFDGNDIIEASHINAYLLDAPDVWIEGRNSTPPKGMSKLVKGSEPTDDGNLFLTPKEREDLLRKHPELDGCIKPFIGAKEFMNGIGGETGRFCLWLVNVPHSLYESVPEINERLKRIRDFRLSSSADRVRKKADVPEQFCQIRQPDSEYIIVPRHTSSNRSYIPLGFIDPSFICGDSASLIPNSSLYQFGVMMSKVHYAWTAIVCGRLGTGFRYSPSVYNNFPWPTPNEAQKKEIERCAQAVLDARTNHPARSIAEMYDGISPLPPNPAKSDFGKYDLAEYKDLRDAHIALDSVVEAAYGIDFQGDEEKIVSHLFKLYAEKAEGK